MSIKTFPLQQVIAGFDFSDELVFGITTDLNNITRTVTESEARQIAANGSKYITDIMLVSTQDVGSDIEAMRFDFLKGGNDYKCPGMFVANAPKLVPFLKTRRKGLVQLAIRPLNVNSGGMHEKLRGLWTTDFGTVLDDVNIINAYMLSQGNTGIIFSVGVNK